MSVQFVIDPFDIDAIDAIIAEPNSIESLRHTINQHLKSHNNRVLRIRFNNLALFKRFSYFEGVHGVLATQHLIPRSVYRDGVKQVLPDWLSDELIIQLDLLEHVADEVADVDLIDRIIKACDPDLLSDDFVIFVQALIRQSDAFWRLLHIVDVHTHFKVYLMRRFEFSEEISALFIENLLQSLSAADFFVLLSYEQHQELLRQRFAQFKLAIPLAARSLPNLLLQTPLLALSEASSKELPIKCLKALEELCRLVEKGEIEAVAIAQLVIAPWSLVLKRLKILVQNNVGFISSELIAQLESFQDKQSDQFARELTEQLVLTQFGPLSDESTVNEVRAWSQGYFDCIRQQFLSRQKVDDTLNLSFSNWLIKQSARIARSDSDWRQFSKRVESFLAQDYLVVVCMVDALSALNQDLLLENAAKVEHLAMASETLFAPLPTLTEVGKMALITGKEANQLPSDQEMAIRQCYGQYLPEKESLKFVKSWKFASEHIEEKTNLVVFLENRIDERLHDCVDFEKHRKDVSLVLRQMMASIENWKKDAAYMNREVVFLVTADHGMTVTQSDYKAESLGEAKERVFKVPASYKEAHEDFALVKVGKKAYLAPKTRVRLDDEALLTHGGLTPEEVLIPLVTLSSRQPEAMQTPLELKVLNEKCQRLKEKSWQIHVELNAYVAVENICIKFLEPLIGEESVVAMAKNGTQRLLLGFSSKNEQAAGMIEFAIQFSYEREGAHEVNVKHFSCVLPEPLISKDPATQGFEGMF
ncbi:MAG: hypothetical protein RQ733_13695 [Methyloprofundus sp.]|nr:hypothetical protein [Methyloprofundus sp.]MDT8427017.1 hypothetical protein [Methyloprofundus sp.]